LYVFSKEKNYALILKKLAGLNDFFTKSSGHPDRDTKKQNGCRTRGIFKVRFLALVAAWRSGHRNRLNSITPGFESRQGINL
jgi:hypothetical protein